MLLLLHSFSGNNIGDMGVVAIVEALKYDKTLARVNGGGVLEVLLSHKMPPGPRSSPRLLMLPTAQP